MKAIVNVDLNWGIGYKGNLLQRIPEDMKFFKKTTIGKVVVMGRKTFESLPGQEPLKDRVNIILSAKGEFGDDRLIVCRSLGELFAELKKYPGDDIFIIGGESVYSLLLPYCSEAYVTKVQNTYEADTYFKNLDEDESWELVTESETKDYNGIKFKFVTYENRNQKSWI
ncbi:MAG TPA: dihydrofolate reductase [Clostridiaceae bacterium]|nr:dihydrofolate reductase [Clostridiaceae bacterium]